MSTDYYLACDDCKEALFVHKWPGWAVSGRPIEKDLLPWLVRTFEFLRDHSGHRIQMLTFDEYPHGEGRYAEANPKLGRG